MHEFKDGQAFMENFLLEPQGRGDLSGLRFAVKDLIDIAGKITGCGNPTWRNTHGPASANATCVDQLLQAGATCLGKTISDELAFSIIGANHFYGTPLNPKAPDRVPGGSSSGSASAVARGIVDFSLGTDTGGSVRVPASNCGIWGLRPTHGAISLDGVMPFAPSFDTVGIFAADCKVLTLVAKALLPKEKLGPDRPGAIHFLEDAFELADPEVRSALTLFKKRIGNHFPGRTQSSTLESLGLNLGKGFFDWHETYRINQWVEVEKSLGGWIDQCHPVFGPALTKTFEQVRTMDKNLIPPALDNRELLCQRIQLALGGADFLCIPTAPSVAPEKNNIPVRDHNQLGYYTKALSLTALAGIGRLPQISLPVAQAEGCPIGLSFIGPPFSERQLLEFAGLLSEAFCVTLH
ncbi:MAG: amidase [Gemmataceae bacterium]|nr:amidase [Gemmataceae bacterium]